MVIFCRLSPSAPTVFYAGFMPPALALREVAPARLISATTTGYPVRAACAVWRRFWCDPRATNAEFDRGGIPSGTGSGLLVEKASTAGALSSSSSLRKREVSLAPTGPSIALVSLNSSMLSWPIRDWRT